MTSRRTFVAGSLAAAAALALPISARAQSTSARIKTRDSTELLVKEGRFAEAVSLYDDALAYVPGHWIARLGRARALACLGEKTRARAAYAELLAQWSHADPDLPDLVEVKSGATGLLNDRCRSISSTSPGNR